GSSRVPRPRASGPPLPRAADSLPGPRAGRVGRAVPGSAAGTNHPQRSSFLLDAVAAPLEAGRPGLLERVLFLGVLGLGGLLRLGLGLLRGLLLRAPAAHLDGLRSD